LDATPLLGQRTGVGRYVENLLAALVRTRAVDLCATAFTFRGARRLTGELPSGVSASALPVPARLLQASWRWMRWPRAELLTGRHDVFHGTNFLVPPAKAKRVVTVHDLAYRLHADTVSATTLSLARSIDRGVAEADAICVPSHAVAAEIRSHLAVEEQRLFVTHLGVGEAWFRARPVSRGWLAERGIPDRFVLFVGTTEPRKNLSVLMEAYREAPSDELPPLVLAGPAGWGTELDSAGIPPGRLIRVGYLPEKELRGLVAAAAALLFPSRYEGFGLPPLEALACGVPVLASDLPVLRETMGGRPGAPVFLPPSQPEAWAKALAALPPREADSDRERRRLAASYTWEETARRTVKAYGFVGA
jgi:glycosyltransferase involved in cell wall biosynthesis